MERLQFFLIITLLSLSNHVFTADISLLTETAKGYLLPFPKECSDILDTFAQYASDFTLCSIQNARPVRVCKKCVDHMVKFDNKYNELLNTVVNGTSCRSLLISRDRLDVIWEYHQSIRSIWEKGNCRSCFDWSAGEPVLSNNTILFNTKFNATTQCIVNNYNLNSSEICNTCMPYYLTLDEFYKTLSTDSIGVDSVCMDIVDSMNATRAIWSKTLNCCKLRRTPEIIFLCCTGIISFLPLLFYLAVKFCGPIKDLPNVLKQSRFKQTFLRSSN